MRVNLIDVTNVAKCMEEVMPNVRVSIDFQRVDFATRGSKDLIVLSVDDVEKERELFTGDYDDMFDAYKILLGIYYGACIAKEKVFDHYPVPQFAEF